MSGQLIEQRDHPPGLAGSGRMAKIKKGADASTPTSFCFSVLNQKFATLRCLGLSIVSAEAFDGGADVVGGLGPFEWLGMGIVMTDEVHNVCAQGWTLR